MNYTQSLPDDEFPEIKIQVYKFDIMEYSVHCILLDNQNIIRGIKINQIID
jgi:hypothetical protein